MYCSDEQKQVVEAKDPFILLNGCAGSRKTDTLVKICMKHFAAKKNVLIVTLVGSVTNEIKERIQGLIGDSSFEKMGNHYVYTDGETSIEIANYDAMLHTQLGVYKDIFNFTYGSCFNKKAVRMHDKYLDKHDFFKMRNGVNADVLLMDEFQDLQPIKAKILTGILKNASTTGHQIQAMAAGDYVQSIFSHAFVEGEKHPMDIWKEDLAATYFVMTKCFRCPKAHVDLVNHMLVPFKDRFDLPPMESSNEDIANKPVLFCHPNEKWCKNASVISSQVCAMLRELKAKHENELHPRDIAIIMPKSNKNHVFHELALELSDVYKEWGHDEAIEVFETKGDGFVRPIDWSKAVGRTVMLSIHGDKGKGHKVVFFMGLSEGVIPATNRLFTTNELIDVSLMNVAMTRSTKWLFMGINAERPSRYIRNVWGSLSDFAICSWESSHGLVAASNRVIDEYHKRARAPIFNDALYITHKVNAPDSYVAQVKDNICNMYEHPMDIVPYYNWAPKKIRFGASANFALPDNKLALYGVMGEIIFMREYCKDRELISKNFANMLKENGMWFTNNEYVINILKQECYNKDIFHMSDAEYVCKMNTIITEHASHPWLVNTLERIRDSKPRKMVAPIYLKNESIMQDIALFLSNAPNTEMPSRVFWNVAIVHTALNEPVKNYQLRYWINDFDCDISILINNAKNLAERITDITFHRSYKLMSHEADGATLQDMGIVDKASVGYGIVGISDFEMDDEIFEIKCPRPNGQCSISNQWTIQPLMYMCLNPTKRHISTINVIDLTNGIWYRYENVDTINRWLVIKSILTKLNHRPPHIHNLLTQL